MKVAILVLLALAAGCAGGGGADDAGSRVAAPPRVLDSAGVRLVVLDSAEVRRSGIATATVEAYAGRATERLAATVVAEPGAVVTVTAPVDGRVRAADAGWPAFGAAVDSGVALATVGDARPVTAPVAGTVLGVPARPGLVVAAGSPLLVIGDPSRVLVQVPWGDAAPAPDAITVVAGGARVRAARLGLAPEADSASGWPVHSYRPARPHALRAGMRILVEAPVGAALAGVRLPAGAVVQWEGLTWAWVERAPGRYERVAVTGATPVGEAVVATGGPAPGARVVVRGAQLLLSEEFRGRVTVGEEVGD